jgi:hypothetical protein
MSIFNSISSRCFYVVVIISILFSLNISKVYAAQDTYSVDEILLAVENLFGTTSKGIASVVERTFQDLGKPNGYIVGDEIAGAFIVGLRYGRGELIQKGNIKQPIFWQGPSVGFDFGGDASKTFALIYDMSSPDDLYRRFPSVDGSFYFVAGASVNYQTDGILTIAPIRTGIGLRAGANLGYLHYTPVQNWLPL